MRDESFITPSFIIPVSDGLVVPVQQDPVGIEVKSVEPVFEITEYGMSMTIGRIVMPLSLVSLHHLLENGQCIYFYVNDHENYMAVFLGEKKLDRDKLLKLLGGWEVLHGNA